MEKQILDEMFNKQVSAIEAQLETAFLEHFGFPFKEVHDPENLEHIIYNDGGTTKERFEYRGQTFLIYKRGEIDFEKTEDGYQITINSTFQKV